MLKIMLPQLMMKCFPKPNSFVLASLFMVMNFAVLQAQEVAPPQEVADSSYWQAHGIFDFGITIGLPSGPLRRNIDQTLIGYQAAALMNFQKRPGIFGGVSLSNYRFGRSNGVFPLAINGIVEDFDIYSWISLLNLHWTFRVMPPWQKRVTPYIEASIGTKRLGVKSEVYFPGEDRNEVDPVESYFQDQDWALSYGGAIGTNIRLRSWNDDDLLLHFSLQYFPGTTIDYYVLENRNTGQFLDPLEAYDSKFSTSDLWQVNIGLTFALGSNYAFP